MQEQRPCIRNSREKKGKRSRKFIFNVKSLLIEAASRGGDISFDMILENGVSRGQHVSTVGQLTQFNGEKVKSLFRLFLAEKHSLASGWQKANIGKSFLVSSSSCCYYTLQHCFVSVRDGGLASRSEFSMFSWKIFFKIEMSASICSLSFQKLA